MYYVMVNKLLEGEKVRNVGEVIVVWRFGESYGEKVAVDSS